MKQPPTIRQKYRKAFEVMMGNPIKRLSRISMFCPLCGRKKIGGGSVICSCEVSGHDPEFYK